jgi:hypothetical protein
MASDTRVFSYSSQTFFQIGCFSRLKPQTDRLEKTLLAQRLCPWRAVVMILILQHNNSVVSRQSIGEIAGTSGIQPNEFQAAFKK